MDAEQVAELEPEDRLGLLTALIAEHLMELNELRRLRAETIRALVDAGWPVTRVAADLGISRETAHQELRRIAAP